MRIFKSKINNFKFKIIDHKQGQPPYCECIESPHPGNKGYYQVGQKFIIEHLNSFIEIPQFTNYITQCELLMKEK